MQRIYCIRHFSHLIQPENDGAALCKIFIDFLISYYSCGNQEETMSSVLTFSRDEDFASSILVSCLSQCFVSFCESKINNRPQHSMRCSSNTKTTPTSPECWAQKWVRPYQYGGNNECLVCQGLWDINIQTCGVHCQGVVGVPDPNLTEKRMQEKINDYCGINNVLLGSNFTETVLLFWQDPHHL